MHCWFNVLSWYTNYKQQQDLSLSAVPWAWQAKLCATISPVKEATMATHTLGLNFAMKPWAESLALMNVIMFGPYLKRTQLLYVIWWYHLWAACPCLSWSAVAFSKSISVELDSERSIVSTFLHERALLARVQIWNVRIYQFFKFKFSVYGHTYICKQNILHKTPF